MNRETLGIAVQMVMDTFLLNLFIALLIVNLFHLVKYRRLKKLSWVNFPGVDAQKFDEWKSLKVISYKLSLLASWGFLGVLFISSCCRCVLNIMLAGSYPNWEDRELIPKAIWIVSWLALVVTAAVWGCAAKKFQKNAGILW